MIKFFIILLILMSCSSSSKSLRNTHYGNKNPKETKVSKKKTTLNKVAANRSYNSFINKWLGVPYKWGGMSLNGVDCSGFVYKYYQNIYKLTINRTTSKQYKQGRFVKRKYLKRGDLVFFKGTTNKPGITHVGVYLSNNDFVHASTSKGVTVSNLSETYYKKHYAGARRIIQ